MKLHRDTHVATGEGFESVADFSIEMNDKAFTVLSDTIYKDKIGSIVRELSCNAFDAHVESGNADKPFDIHLPDAFEPYFIIRDYGSGISPSDIKKVYTKYFASTKDSSNDVVGAFGLGSKTPFAYTDAFTVISIHKGVKTMYNAHKSRGLPAIVAYGESEPTDEPDGLEVRVSVEAMDYKAFASAVKRQLKFFSVKPNILNGEIEWETYTPVLEVPGFTYYTVDGAKDRQYYYYNARKDLVTTGLFLKQGPVGYPVDFDMLDQVLDSKGQSKSSFYEYLKTTVNNHYTNKGIIIDMPIGTVEVTASREGISYKDATVRNIMTRLDQIAKVISKEVLVKLDESYKESNLDFIKMLEDLDGYFKHSLSAELMNKRYPKFDFRNESYGVKAFLRVPSKLFTHVDVRKYDIQSYSQARVSQSYVLQPSLIDSGDETKGYKEFIRLNLSDISGCSDYEDNENVVYVKDINNGFVARLQEYNKGTLAILLDLPDGTTKDDVAKHLGSAFTVRNVSELPKVVNANTRKAQGGHSITGGRQRLWFELNNKTLSAVLDADRTCYAANCKQVFGESFEEAPNDKYAFFKTYNNKINKEDNLDFADSVSMCQLFCDWLREQGYSIVAIAGSMTKKAIDSGKFSCINELWEKYETTFRNEVWSIFIDTMTTNYYDVVCNTYLTHSWRGPVPFTKYNELFDLLNIVKDDSLKNKVERLTELGNNKFNTINRAIYDIIKDDDDKRNKFTQLRDALGSRYESHNTLEGTERLLREAGVKLEIVGSELRNEYINLIKDNVDKIAAGCHITDIDFERIDFVDPFSRESDKLSNDELKEELKKKLGGGA